MVPSQMTMTTGTRSNTKRNSGLRLDAPLIRMVTPGTNFTVGGIVFILIDAVGRFDPTGSLKVEISVDGTTPIAASYSPVSGYYGAIWDSTTVPSGSLHTLVATATDSAGKSKSTNAVVSIG